jgi:hypothetical protein
MKLGVIYYIFFSLIIKINVVSANDSIQSLYPNRLLTDSYGIVTDIDLAYDNSRRDSIPYNPNKFSSALYWQCFPINEVKLKYRTWPEDNPENPKQKPVIICDLNYIVNHDRETQVYSGRRAYPVSYCRSIFKDWQRITKGQKIVCLDGQGGEYVNERSGQKIKSWTWDKIKTKKGCYSYFEGECSNIIEK